MNESDAKKAYLAMFSFLENHWIRTKSDELGALLGSMSLLPDGGTADPAVWQEWIRALERSETGEVDAQLRLSKGKK